MKKITYFLILLVLFSSAYAQRRVVYTGNNIKVVPKECTDKILNGQLISKVKEKISILNRSTGKIVKPNTDVTVAIYFPSYPSAQERNGLEALGVKICVGSWTPAVGNHSLGFILASVPAEKFSEVVALDYVKKIDDAEVENKPNNNTAAKKIKADSVWAQGWTGTGVKVAILDSGLDTDPVNPDLPASIIKRDYSNYPKSIDNNVENTVSGHGTHVVGSVLGRGAMSNKNTLNGGGSYKGMAPGADLIFLKIGNDANSNGSAAAEIAAVHAAVDTFKADIISMSYGGWDAYHDGSSATEQAFDWAYSKGAAVFLSAGNEAADDRHYSGTVPANGSTDFIKVNVTGADSASTAVYFNLIWKDANKDSLCLKYYDANKVPYADSLLYWYPVTKSSRGTSSQYSCYNYDYAPKGNSIYYIKVVNAASAERKFHLYEVWNDGCVTFDQADPNYTIGSPSSADHAFSVGAYVSRLNWQCFNGKTYHYTGYVADTIASFSSKGPRIDEVIKPNISAPGSMIISIKDRDVFTKDDAFTIFDDTSKVSKDYYGMQGTSMATPVCAGAAALIKSKFPSYTPQQIYDAIAHNAIADKYTTASLPNNIWGAGKLNVLAAVGGSVPVELTSFTAATGQKNIQLKWTVATESNNSGFEIQKSSDKVNFSKIGFVTGRGTSSESYIYSYSDASIGSSKAYYRLKQIDYSGAATYSSIVEANKALPQSYSLKQNYPNPFNPSTVIKYELPFDSKVKLTVYNMIGEKVKELVNTKQSAGYQETSFNAQGLASGVYLLRMEAVSQAGNAKNFISTKKMMMIK
jgi:subtilisin family serine protease